MKAIISRMPLLVTATRESIYNSMRGEDIKKHRNGATSNVNGVIFSNLHPKIDARIVKVEDYPHRFESSAARWQRYIYTSKNEERRQTKKNLFQNNEGSSFFPQNNLKGTVGHLTIHQLKQII